uniref:ionotropic receptor 119 precursor n=1 Tax=Aedes aegypti TaxID=7159 RepID=UPI00043BBE7A|nr:ionotropic receptor 119 precursor [Aedes aegypti]
MTPLVFVLTLFITNRSAIALNALQYTASVVRHLSDRQIGTFTSWIYRMGPSSESILDVLLQYRVLRTTPKLTMTSMNAEIVDPFRWQPSLIIVEWLQTDIDLLSDTEWDHLKLNVINGEVKVLVLHWFQIQKEIWNVLQLFYGYQMHYTRFVSLIDGTVCHFNIFSRKTICEKAPPVSELFFDQTNDLLGYTVRASFQGIVVGTTMFPKRDVYGADILWISSTAFHLNGSVEVTRLECDKTQIPVYDCMKRRVERDGVIYDINLDNYHTTQIYTSNIITAQPDKIVIMAPRGRRLTALEMFSVPFTVIVWCLMTLLVAVCWITTWTFPNLTVNDPVFVSIFGIEKISIHDTSRHEKLILLSLIWLFFFLTNAFESKLIALMTSYPHVESPRTLEDLHSMNLKFRIAENHSLFFFTDPVLRSLLEVVPAGNVTRDEYFAQIGDEDQADILMNDVDHYDFEAKRSRFVKLEEFQMGMVHRQHRIRDRSPLAHQFVRTDRIFFEAGIRQHWTDLVKHNYHLSSHFEFESVSMDNSNDLDMNGLEPAWYVIAIGLTSSIIVYLMEWLIFKGNRRLSYRRKSFKTNYSLIKTRRLF